MMVLPSERREHAGVWGPLNETSAADNLIKRTKAFLPYAKAWHEASGAVAGGRRKNAGRRIRR